MRTLSLISILFGLVLFLTKSATATELPALISPSDGTYVTTSKLSWSVPTYALYSTTPYRVQVDNDADFSSTLKDTTTASTSYTPTLDPGKYYWHLKIKDSTGVWSDWSTAWSFNLNIPAPSPSASVTIVNPSPSFSPSPSQVPSSTSFSPSPSITASVSPSPIAVSPSPSPSPQFLISSTPNSINSDQSFWASINLSNNPNSIFYLKGAFIKSGSTNYFGLTNVFDAWIKNSSTYSNQYKITTDGSGNWSGNLVFKPDTDDTGYTGSGDYNFKVARYSNTGSGPTWSNEVTITIKSSTANSNPFPTPSQSAFSPSPSTSVEPQPSLTASSSALLNFDSSLVDHQPLYSRLTDATPSAEKTPTKQSYQNWIIIITAGIISLFSGIAWTLKTLKPF